jgi:hypothetical protein
MNTTENLGVPMGKGKHPANKIKSPAETNEEAYENLGGLPNKKTLEEIHGDLKPQKQIPGVEKSKSRVI